jgi:hypothetical protein
MERQTNPYSSSNRQVVLSNIRRLTRISVGIQPWFREDSPGRYRGESRKGMI